jgi:lipopolysaccharide/colanic/teichoic acid biosynthesis glycosyltransferase
MTDARDAKGELLDDAQRTPPFGHFIRRYRLDELPSLYSVLKGDVSMVGPRPLIPHVRASLLGGTARQAMRPGFTGLAQVSGNTLLSDEEKIALDLYYIAHWSWALDFEVLVRTVGTVLFGEKRREPLIARALAEWTPAPGAAHG